MVNDLIIHVLGTAQDGGYPHAGCKDVCCLDIWDKPSSHRLPASVAVVDKINDPKLQTYIQKFLVEKMESLIQ